MHSVALERVLEPTMCLTSVAQQLAQWTPNCVRTERKTCPHISICACHPQLIESLKIGLGSCHPSVASLFAHAAGDPAVHTNGAVPARAVTMPFPASVSCPCIRGSVLSLNQHQAPSPPCSTVANSMQGSCLSPASPVRLVEAWKCGAIHHSPHPAIQVAASFIGRVAVLPAACPIALDLMKESHVSIEHC